MITIDKYFVVDRQGDLVCIENEMSWKDRHIYNVFKCQINHKICFHK